MNPEKPIWLWKSNNEYALLQLFLLILGFYLITKLAVFLTHRYELIQKHGKRLDRLAFKSKCTLEERNLLQDFYIQLKPRHRVLLAHNHIKDYLRMHLLSFLVGKKTENLNAFLAMISKMIGTANEPEFELKKNEFVILKLNQFSSFGQILSADFNLYTIILAETKHILTTSQIKNSEIFYFRNSKGIIKVKGTILEKSNRSVKFLRLTK